MSTSHGGCYRLVIDTFGRRSDYEAAKYDDDGTVDRFQGLVLSFYYRYKCYHYNNNMILEHTKKEREREKEKSNNKQQKKKKKEVKK